MSERPESVIDFWFGKEGTNAVVAKRQTSLWFKKQASTDALIKERFENTLRSAAAGELDHWGATPMGRLALIIVLDQLPRNIYRDSPAAFAFDQLARSHCQAGLERFDDAVLPALYRVFFYLPLEHAEDHTLQARSVALFEALVAEAGEDEKALFNGYLDYAQRHAVIIERFGRFPHRNAIVRRESTAQELAFLAQPGSSF